MQKILATLKSRKETCWLAFLLVLIVIIVCLQMDRRNLQMDNERLQKTQETQKIQEIQETQTQETIKQIHEEFVLEDEESNQVSFEAELSTMMFVDDFKDTRLVFPAIFNSCEEEGKRVTAFSTFSTKGMQGGKMKLSCLVKSHTDQEKIGIIIYSWKNDYEPILAEISCSGFFRTNNLIVRQGMYLVEIYYKGKKGCYSFALL